MARHVGENGQLFVGACIGRFAAAMTQAAQLVAGCGADSPSSRGPCRRGGTYPLWIAGVRALPVVRFHPSLSGPRTMTPSAQ